MYESIFYIESHTFDDDYFMHKRTHKNFNKLSIQSKFVQLLNENVSHKNDHFVSFVFWWLADFIRKFKRVCITSHTVVKKQNVRAFIFGEFLFNFFHHENSFWMARSRTHTYTDNTIFVELRLETCWQIRTEQTYLSPADRHMCMYAMRASEHGKPKKNNNNLIHLVYVFVLIGQMYMQNVLFIISS